MDDDDDDDDDDFRAPSGTPHATGKKKVRVLIVRLRLSLSLSLSVSLQTHDTEWERRDVSVVFNSKLLGIGTNRNTENVMRMT